MDLRKLRFTKARVISFLHKLAYNAYFFHTLYICRMNLHISLSNAFWHHFGTINGSTTVNIPSPDIHLLNDKISSLYQILKISPYYSWSRYNETTMQIMSQPGLYTWKIIPRKITVRVNLLLWKCPKFHNTEIKTLHQSRNVPKQLANDNLANVMHILQMF